jgi:hypothetical protein
MQDSNIPLKNVTRERSSSSVRQPRAFARVLSFLLLGFIVYGTTVEAAHKHDNLVEPANSARGASVADPATGNEVISKIASGGECLICQLHQHFAASLIAVRESESPQQTRLGISQPKTPSFTTRTDSPRAGRAPPLAN